MGHSSAGWAYEEDEDFWPFDDDDPNDRDYVDLSDVRYDGGRLAVTPTPLTIHDHEEAEKAAGKVADDG